MIKKLFSLFIVSLLIISGINLGLVEANTQIPQKPINSPDMPKLSSGFFTENKGQWDESILYMGNTSFGKVAFTKDAIYYQLIKTEKRNERNEKDINRINPEDRFNSMSRLSEKQVEEEQEEKFESQIIKLSFVNPQTPKVKAEGLLTHYNNYFIGNNPNKWATECHNYTKVYYEDIWNGVDLAYFFNNEGLKYEFYARPNSDISKIKIDVQGADLELENNKLKIDTPIGSLFDSKLISYTEESNKQINVSFSKEDNTYSFQIEPNFKTNETIIIDPLIYSTFVGGNSSDYCDSIAIDSSANAYVTGYTSSSSFPVTAGAYDTTYNGNFDAFVFKLNSTGSSLIYSTFVGGSGNEGGYSIAIDSSANAYVTGYTYSSNFPVTTEAYDTTYNNGDAFVFKLNSTGSSLIYSTFVGGSGNEGGNSIAIDSSANAYVTGYTYSSDFPVTTEAYDTTFNGNFDVFVFKLNSTGSSLIYSTFVGGSDYDGGYSIAIDSSSNAYVTGYTSSSSFPVTVGAYGTTFNGGSDVFVFKLNSTGSSLIYSTFVGGSDYDGGYSIAIDSSANAYVTGYTSSSSFPVTAGAYDTTYNGNFDAFVFKLNSTGSSLIYSTFVGGSGNEGGYSITIDSSSNAYVTGTTYSSNFPVTAGAYDTTFNGYFDAFVFKLNSTGSSLIYSTFVGGSSNDYGYSIAIDSFGFAYVTGITYSSDFPVTAGAYDTTFNGGYDAFVFKISLFILPSSPSPLQGILNYDKVHLSWNESTAGTYPIKGYQIYRANISDGIYQPLIFIDGVNTTSYIDTSGLIGNTYSYYVVAVDENGNTSIPSNTVTVGPIQHKPEPSLFLSPELNRKEYYPGDEVIIKLQIMNKGNGDATNTKLTMTLPQDIEYVKADLLRGSVFGNSVEFNVGKILAEDTTTFYIYCKVKSNIRNDKSVDIIFDVTCKENSTDRESVHLLIKPKRGEVKPVSIGIYLKNIKSDPDTGEAYIDFDTPLELTLKIDGGTAPYILNIDWGDGSSKEEKKVDISEINLTHKFESRGTIEIKFEVTDSVGRNKKATVKLKVK